MFFRGLINSTFIEIIYLTKNTWSNFCVFFFIKRQFLFTIKQEWGSAMMYNIGIFECVILACKKGGVMKKTLFFRVVAVYVALSAIIAGAASAVVFITKRKH